MKKQDAVTAQSIINAHKGIYRELYAECLLICGDENSAQAAILDVMLSRRTKLSRRHTFDLAKEYSLKHRTVQDAVFGCLENVESAQKLASEQPWARRAIMLIFACEMNERQTAKIVGKKPGEVRASIRRTVACVEGNTDVLRHRNLKRICKAELSHFAYAPDMLSVKRALENRMAREAENSEMTGGRKLLLSNLAAILMLLVIGFVLWAGMVMLNYFRDTAINSAEEKEITLEDGNASLSGTD